MAKTPQLVNPGNPESSLIFTQIIKQQMPYDLYNEGKPVAEPTREDLATLACGSPASAASRLRPASSRNSSATRT